MTRPGYFGFPLDCIQSWRRKSSRPFSTARQSRSRDGQASFPNFKAPTSSRSSSLSTPSDLGGGLRRKKSMLSRQIHNPFGYQDGADRLERKRSSVHGSPDPNLEELESLVSEPNHRLSVDSPATEENGDIILPSVPGKSLKRSTRTNYRRGGSVKGRGDRGTYAQRMARKATGGDETPTTPSTPDVPAMPTFSTEVSNLANTLSFSPSSSEPAAGVNKREAHNFSRPALTRVPSPPSQPPSQQPPWLLHSTAFSIRTIRIATARQAHRRGGLSQWGMLKSAQSRRLTSDLCHKS